MIFKHNEYLNFELPKNWCAEEDGENLLLYNPDGDGAMVVSFLAVLEPAETLNEQISILAKRFVDQNRIALHSPLILHGINENKKILYGSGTTPEGWFVKLWVVAKCPKIVFVTYHSEKKTKEVKKCDAIVDSIRLTF